MTRPGDEIRVVTGTAACGLTPPETTGGGQNPCHPCALRQQNFSYGVYGKYPVDPGTGEVFHSFNDLAIPGRGPALDLTRTYSTNLASEDGPFGFGWTDPYAMHASVDSTTGDVTISQENGSTATFTQDGSGGFTAPGHDIATLTLDGAGNYVFERLTDQTTYTIDQSGRLLSEVDRNGYTTSLSYSGGSLQAVTDPAGRKLTFSYNAGGRVSKVTDPAGCSVSFSYDGSGNLTSTTDVGGGVWHFTYEQDHLMLTMTDPRGGRTTNTYDGQGRIVSQTDRMDRTSSFSYTTNTDGSETTLVTDPLGNVTRYDYMDLLLAARTDGYGTPDAATTTFGYDSTTLAPNSVTDPNDHTTTYTYDGEGNLLSRTDPLNNTTTYTYNSFNEVKTVTDPLNVTTTNTYDASGNLLSNSTPVGSQTATTSYSYGDPTHPGDVTAMTDPNGHTWRYTRDASGDLASVTDPLGDKTSYTYDAIGRRLTAVAPKGNASGANPKNYITTYTTIRSGT
jgi:YD repeat-containing protein